MSNSIPATVFVRAPLYPEIAGAIGLITSTGAINAVLVGTPSELALDEDLNSVFSEVIVCKPDPGSYLQRVVVRLARADAPLPAHAILFGIPLELRDSAMQQVQAVGVRQVDFVP